MAVMSVGTIEQPLPNSRHTERRSWLSLEGASLPQGVSWIEEERSFNFALYSKHAENVTLLLFAGDDVSNPVLSRTLDPRIHKSGRMWHCRIPEEEARSAHYYAYRVSGPKPEGRFEWHWLDPEKVLLDPCAEAVFFPPTFERGASVHPGANVGKAPLRSFSVRSSTAERIRADR